MWGNMKYNNKYYVIESELELKSDYFLDLVGNRKHMKFMVTVMKQYAGNRNWSIGALIEFLKKLSEIDAKVFPFKVIRAVDNSITKQTKYYFVEGKPNFTDLTPRIAICLLDLNVLYLKSKKIIYQSTN